MPATASGALADADDRQVSVLPLEADANVTVVPPRGEELTETVFVRFWRDPRGFRPADGPLAVQLIRRMTGDLSSGHEQRGVR